MAFKSGNVILFIISFWGLANADSAMHADSVTFKNGDHLSGRLREVTPDFVSFDSPSVGLLTIRWSEISAVYSRERRWKIEDQRQSTKDVGGHFRVAVFESKGTTVLAKVDGAELIVPSGYSMKVLDQEHSTSGPQVQTLQSKSVTPQGTSSFAVSLNAPLSVVDGTQSQQTFGGTLRILHNEPDLCDTPNWFSALLLSANHNRTYKVNSPSIVTDTFDGTVSLEKSLAKKAKLSGILIADFFGNSSLGVGLQQSFGGGISRPLYTNECHANTPALPTGHRLTITSDLTLRYIKQRLYAPSPPLDLVGLRINEGLVYVSLVKDKEGNQKPRFQIDQSLWVTPMLNNSKAVQAGGSFKFSVPISDSLSVGLITENDFINNAPKARRKNYLKNAVTVSYSFPPSSK
jgi:hypothetical protein